MMDLMGLVENYSLVPYEQIINIERLLTSIYTCLDSMLNLFVVVIAVSIIALIFKIFLGMFLGFNMRGGEKLWN